MPKLTERRHLQTRAEIAHAAVELFMRRGFDETTMAEVAEAAGVSRRTVYRHFPTKNDLVFEYPRRWLAHFDRELTTRSNGESLRDLLRRALLSISESIEDDAEPVAAAFSVVQSSEALSGTHRTSDEVWANRILELFGSEPEFTPDLLQPCAVVATAVVAGTNTAIALWAMGGQTTRLPAITAGVLDQLNPIWPREFR